MNVDSSVNSVFVVVVAEGLMVVSKSGVTSVTLEDVVGVSGHGTVVVLVTPLITVVITVDS